MEQQVVIELLNLMGKRSIEFTDALKVKMSPHTHPVIINKISLPVKQTIGQRLRLILSQQ